MASEGGLTGTLLHLGEEPLATHHGPFRLHTLRDLSRRRFVWALLRGDVTGTEPLLTRVHSSCVTSESYGGCDCDCALQLDGALEQIAAAGRGLLLYLVQEGRGAGFAAKARDRMLVQASGERLDTFEAYARLGLAGDRRRYAEVPAALELLGVRVPLRLLSNSPQKRRGLAEEGVTLVEAVPLRTPASPWNRHYLAAKTRSGHALEPGAGVGAEPPVPVASFAPHPLERAPRFLRLASYWLPVCTAGAASPRWFRLELCYDRVEQRERIALSCETRAGARPLLHLQGESLRARLAASGPGGGAPEWPQVAARMAARGAGCAVFRASPGEDSTAAGDLCDEASVALLAHHAGAREVEVVGPPGLAAALAARGVRVVGSGPRAA